MIVDLQHIRVEFNNKILKAVNGGEPKVQCSPTYYVRLENNEKDQQFIGASMDFESLEAAASWQRGIESSVRDMLQGLIDKANRHRLLITESIDIKVLSDRGRAALLVGMLGDATLPFELDDEHSVAQLATWFADTRMWYDPAFSQDVLKNRSRPADMAALLRNKAKSDMPLNPRQLDDGPLADHILKKPGSSSICAGWVAVQLARGGGWQDPEFSKKIVEASLGREKVLDILREKAAEAAASGEQPSAE